MPTVYLTSWRQSSGDSLYQGLEFNTWLCIFFSLLLWNRLPVFKVRSPMMLCNLESDFCEKQLNCESCEKPCLGSLCIVLGTTFMDYRQEPELRYSHACIQVSLSQYSLAGLTSRIGKGPAQDLQQHVAMVSCGRPWLLTLVQPGLPH